MPVAAQITRHDRPGVGAIGSRLLGVIVIAWMFAVLGVYYRRLWPLLAAGPGSWTLPDLGQGLLHGGVPHAGAAAVAAASATGAAALLATAFAGTGRIFDGWLTPPQLTPGERLVVRFGNGAGAWSVVLLGLAGSGLYRPSVVRVALMLTAALSAGWVVARFRVSVRPAIADAWRELLRAPAWGLITVAATAAAFVTALAPEIEYDALWYHLELPRRWLAAGHPVDDVTEYISLYPLNWQLLYGAALALDGPGAAKLLHWMALVASASIAASIAGRALGVKSRLLAAAVFVTAPTVLWEATTAYNDLAVALHVGIGAGALWAATREADRRWTWLAAVQLGLACATKHLALVPVAIALALYILQQVRTRGPLSALRSSALVVMVILTLASPWYIRSWLASGNPVFPELYSVFGAQPPERWDHLTERGLEGFKARFGGERRLGDLGRLPWDLTMHGARFGGTLGPLLLMLAPFVVPLWRRSADGRPLIVGVLLYAAVWASPLSSLQLRFLVPWWVFVAPLLAWATEWLFAGAARAGRSAAVLASALLAGVLLLNLPPFIPLHEGDRAGWDGWLTHVIRRLPVEVVSGGVSRAKYLTQEVRTFAAWSYLNEHADANARVLTFFGGDHFYSERPRLWSEAVVARPVTWGAVAETDETLLARLQALGITHVMAPPEHLRPREMRALSLLREDVPMLGEVYRDAWVVVYGVRSAPAFARRTTDHR